MSGQIFVRYIFRVWRVINYGFDDVEMEASIYICVCVRERERERESEETVCMCVYVVGGCV